jgi:hypothetical protein
MAIVQEFQAVQLGSHHLWLSGLSRRSVLDPDAKRPVELAVHGPLARKERLTAFGGAVSCQPSAFSNDVLTADG